jgi:hypothetical protein
VVQFLDWAATFHGIALFGPAVEGNWLLRSLMERYDIILVLTGAKLFATVAGSALHFAQRHLSVAFLTVFYILFALFPWLRVLAVYSAF